MHPKKRGRLMLKCKHTYTLSLHFFFFGELMICMQYKYICRETHDTNSPTTPQKASPFVDIYVVLYHILISHICIPTFLLYRRSVASKIHGVVVSLFLFISYTYTFNLLFKYTNFTFNLMKFYHNRAKPKVM